MKTTISAQYTFEAAHQLHRLPEGHKCKRLHGHNYRVEIMVEGEPDARGFVADYAEIDAVVQPLVARIDHRFLNDIEGLDNPTTEVIAAWFLKRVPMATAVRIWETPLYWAEVRR